MCRIGLFRHSRYVGFQHDLKMMAEFPITVLIVGSYFPSIYYGFYCYPGAQKVYLSTIILAGLGYQSHSRPTSPVSSRPSTLQAQLMLSSNPNTTRPPIALPEQPSSSHSDVQVSFPSVTVSTFTD